MHRRSFLKYAGCAACALGADHLLHASSGVAAEAYAKLDRPARLKLADMALSRAKEAGASYADVRVGRNQREFIRARERRLEAFDARRTERPEVRGDDVGGEMFAQPGEAGRRPCQ